MQHGGSRIARGLIALSLVVSGGAASGCSVTSSPKTDADYEALADAALLDGDTSREARDAYECRSARRAAGLTVEVGSQRAELVGMTAKEMYRTRAAKDGTDLDLSWLHKCPLQGRYGIRVYVARTLHDGTVLWGQEVSCSVHTPEAFVAYEEGLD